MKLTFLGIDTIATIRLNDKLLGNTNNMFVRYTFDVKDLLQSNSDASADLNSLSVLIENPMEVASNLARSNNFTPPNCPPGIYNGECHMNFLRKMQASFAWDWGLAAPSSGLWKGVQLEVYDVAIIRDTTVFMELKDNAWKLRFQVYLETGVASSRVKGQLEILLPGINNSRVTVQIDKQSDENGELIADLDVTVPEEQVKLWWPNGFGEQVLYTVHVSFEQHDNQVQADRLKDTKTLRIGFRTIKLIQEPLGKKKTKYNFLFTTLQSTNPIQYFIEQSSGVHLFLSPFLNKKKSLGSISMPIHPVVRYIPFPQILLSSHNR